MMLATVRFVVLMRLLVVLCSRLVRMQFLCNLLTLLSALVLVRLVASAMTLALGMVWCVGCRKWSMVLVLLVVLRGNLTNMVSQCCWV